MYKDTLKQILEHGVDDFTPTKDSLFEIIDIFREVTKEYPKKIIMDITNSCIYFNLKLEDIHDSMRYDVASQLHALGLRVAMGGYLYYDSSEDEYFPEEK